MAAGPAAFVVIDGIGECEARDFAWESNILALADQWSVTLPAPEGKITTTGGERIPVAQLKEGAKVTFHESDPDVDAGSRKLKMTGRLVTYDDSESSADGFLARLAGFDLGWHLTTGCGVVFRNVRGVKWSTFLAVNVLNAADKWGFVGVRGGNLENKITRIGARAALESAKFRGAKEKPQPGAIQPRFQIEVGESLSNKIIDAAKWERLLVNVSADGWLQFFNPATTASEPLYFFHHELANDGMPLGNISNTRLRRSADTLFTVTQCWTSIVRQPPNADTTNPNYGRYSGQFIDASLLDFARRDTFSDPNQMGKDRAAKRAKWKHDRGVFDAWEYTFRTVGHSQGGIPFEPDTVCSLRDVVRGLSGLYYIQSVRSVRNLARAGISTDAGTYSEITIRKPDLLGA